MNQDLNIFRCPREVLVKVQSSSLNPLDKRMADGYGSNVLESLRIAQSGHFGIPTRRGFSVNRKCPFLIFFNKKQNNLILLLYLNGNVDVLQMTRPVEWHDRFITGP